MSEVGKLIAEEQRVVVAGLRKQAAARERDIARAQKRYDAENELLYRGRQAGVPVQEMAAALGLSRQSLHKRLREVESYAAWEERQGWPVRGSGREPGKGVDRG